MGFPSPAHVPSHFFQKPNPFRLSFPHFKPIVANMKSKILPALHLLSFIFVPASRTHAEDITWADSAANTTWTTDATANSAPASASWVGGTAPTNSVTTDNAIFTSVSNAQPNLTVQTRINGVDFRMVAGGLAMTGNNNLLQLGANGIDATGQTSGTNTITNTRIFLNNSSTWDLFSTTNTTSTSTLTFDSQVQLNGQTLTIVGQRDSAAGNVGVINFNSALSYRAGGGAGAVTVNSLSTNNTVNFNGQNTYTGRTTASAGNVTVQNDQSAATGGWSIASLSGSTATQASTVSFNSGSTVAVATANKIQIGAAANSGTYAASTLNVAGTVTNSGTLQMERNSILNLSSGASWTQSGNLTVTGRGGTSALLNVNAGSEMTYSGSNTVQLNRAANSGGSGTLTIDSTGVFTTSADLENTVSSASGSGNGRITLTNGGTLKLSADVAKLTTQVNFNLGTGGGVIDNGGFDVALNGAVTGEFGTNYTGVTGTGGLTSKGNGTLNLTGTNTYTGNTLVSAGTLLVTGALATDSNVTVDANAAFGGTATVGGNLGFDKDSIFQITNLNTPLTVGGTVSFGNGFGIANLLGLNWDALTLNTPYTLITTDQIFTASDIGNFGIGNAADVGTGRQAYFQNGSLQVVVIPEPAAALLGGVGLLILLRRRRN